MAKTNQKHKKDVLDDLMSSGDFIEVIEYVDSRLPKLKQPRSRSI